MWLSKRPKRKNLTVFFRGMSLLLNVGEPIPKGLTLFITMFKKEDPIFAAQLQKVCDSITNGLSMTKAFRQAPLLFNPRHISQIKAAETSGTLARAFLLLAEQEDTLQQTRAKLLSALIYPVFVLVFSMILTVLVLPRLVIPAITQMLPQSQTPPALTMWVLHFCQIAQNPLIIGTITIVITFIAQQVRTKPEIYQWFQESIQQIPIIGPGIEAYFLGNFFRVFHQMMLSGISLDLIFKLSAEASGSIRWDKEFQNLRKQDLSESPFPELFNRFPPIVKQMVTIGEESGGGGNLRMLNYLANWYDTQLDDSLTKTASLLEPFLMLGMGILTCIIVLAIMLPLMQVLNTL
jgi:type II secretory pathway component PulF